MVADITTSSGSVSNTPASVSFRQSFRRCGKTNCSTCRNGPGHGPYWYASWRDGNRVRSRYIGRSLPDEPTATEIEVRSLGAFEVRVAGGSPVRWSRRPRELFTMLLAAPTGSVSREEIADTLWPDIDPVAAHQNLRVTISSLRKLLTRPEWIRLEGPAVVLSLPQEARDDVRFENAGRRALERDELELMKVGIEAYGGMFLPADRYSDWTIYRRQELGQLRYRLVRRAAEIATKRGLLEEALTWLWPLWADDQCDEGLARVLMALYLRMGRRTEALRVYHTLAKALTLELDIGPEAETIVLFERARGS